MSKHTPGPWQWFETEDGRARVNPADGGLVIAECSTRNPFDEEQRANARLISAAPELYEALERLIAVYQTSHSPVTRLSCWQQAGAALSKARGES